MRTADGGPVSFSPVGTKVFTLSLTGPRLDVESEFTACLDCGLVWSSTDASKARAKLEVWAKPALKQKLGLE